MEMCDKDESCPPEECMSAEDHARFSSLVGAICKVTQSIKEDAMTIEEMARYMEMLDALDCTHYGYDIMEDEEFREEFERLQKKYEASFNEVNCVITKEGYTHIV
jgi:hypothetical protein